MDLEQFLIAGGADLASLVERVDHAVGLLPGDVLLVVGSLVEGLGTTRSDLDFLLVTDRPADALPDGEVPVVAGQCLADVCVLPLAEVRALAGRLEAWAARSWDVTHASRFSQAERVLLHRLVHGRPVLHHEQSDPDAVPWPSGAPLARLKLHVARQNARTVQVDMAGHRDGGDWRSLTYAAQDLLGLAVDALTAGHGLTNPNPKWRSRLLEWLPAAWEDGLGVRRSGRTAAERVWRLHRAPPRPGAAAALEHAFRVAAFARAAFAWAERRLVTPLDGDPAAPVPRLRRVPADVRLPHLDLDVDFQLAPAEVYLGRLNGFGDTVRLSPPEFALALRFDGATTTREADAALRGVGPAGTSHALVSRMAAARLIAA